MMLSGAVLAAGAAERFGAPKLLLPAGGGETVLSRSVHAMLEAVEGPVFAVLPRESSLHRAALAATDERLVLIENARSAEGLGTSVAAAAKAAVAAGAEGLLLMPADLPYLRPHSLLRLAARYAAERPWAAAAYAGRRPQAPAVFSPPAIAQLTEAKGPRGAQAFLASPDGPVLLEATPAPELADLDGWPAYVSAAQTLGWAKEQAPDIEWADEPAQIAERDFVWRFGPSVSAYFRSGAGAVRLLGSRRDGRIELCAAGGAAAGLALLRAAALIALALGTG